MESELLWFWESMDEVRASLDLGAHEEGQVNQLLLVVCFVGLQGPLIQAPKYPPCIGRTIVDRPWFVRWLDYLLNIVSRSASPIEFPRRLISMVVGVIEKVVFRLSGKEGILLGEG